MNILTAEKSLIDSLIAIQGIKGCQFASVKYRSVKSNELARYTLNLGFNYNTLVEKSLIELEAILPSLTSPDEIQAANELKDSFNATLSAHKDNTQNPAYTKKGMYEPLGNGISINTNTGDWQLFGLVNSKVIITPGVHKPIKSSAKTLAKNKIRKSLSIGKFREFSFMYENVEQLKCDGQTITI